MAIGFARVDTSTEAGSPISSCCLTADGMFSLGGAASRGGSGAI